MQQLWGWSFQFEWFITEDRDQGAFGMRVAGPDCDSVRRRPKRLQEWISAHAAAGPQ